MEPCSKLKFENESFPLAARSVGKVHPEGLGLFSAMGLVWRREAQVSSGVGRFHQRSDNCTVTITNQCTNHRLRGSDLSLYRVKLNRSYHMLFSAEI